MIIQMSTPMKFGKVTKIWFFFNDPLWTYFHWLQQRCTNSGHQVAMVTKSVRWRIIHVDCVWDGLHVASPSWHLEFSGGSHIFGKSVHPCTTVFSHFPFQYVWMSIWGARSVTHPYVYAFWLVYKKKKLVTVVVCSFLTAKVPCINSDMTAMLLGDTSSSNFLEFLLLPTGYRGTPQVEITLAK